MASLSATFLMFVVLIVNMCLAANRIGLVAIGVLVRGACDAV